MADRIDDDAAGGPKDPLGLGGTTPPDAASRRPRPAVVELLIEFFKMSRTTAILLIAFVLAAALYLLVRENPVVAFGTPPRPASAETSTTDPETTRTSDAETTPTDEETATTETSVPTTSGTDTSETTVPQGQRTATPGESPAGDGIQQTPQTPQGQSQPIPQSQEQQQQQPQAQQRDPGVGATSVPGGGPSAG